VTTNSITEKTTVAISSSIIVNPAPAEFRGDSRPALDIDEEIDEGMDEVEVEDGVPTAKLMSNPGY
jgi:hypothetical protein